MFLPSHATFRPHLGALLTSILVVTACAESESMDSSSSDEATIVHPADRAMAVRPGPEILITHDSLQGPNVVKIEGEDREWTLDCWTDASVTMTTCESPSVLGDAADYDLVLEFAGGVTTWTQFSTRTPSSGKAYDLGYDASFTSLGRGDTVAQVLNALVSSWDLAIVHSTESGISDALLMGPASATQQGTYKVGMPGLTTVLPLKNDDGEMLQTQPIDVLLPISTPAGTIALPIHDLAFQASPEEAGLQYTLSGYLEPEALDLLSEAFGGSSSLLGAMVNLDHDLDGDGVLDSASLKLEGWSPSVMLKAWNDSGSNHDLDHSPGEGLQD